MKILMACLVSALVFIVICVFAESRVDDDTITIKVGIYNKLLGADAKLAEIERCE